jgi:hypothetical protein
MTIELEGGCRVSKMDEGHPITNGSLKVWRQIDQSTGAKAIHFACSSLARECRHYFRIEQLMKSSMCSKQLGGKSSLRQPVAKSTSKDRVLRVEAETGIYLKPEQTMLVEIQESLQS